MRSCSGKSHAAWSDAGQQNRTEPQRLKNVARKFPETPYLAQLEIKPMQHAGLRCFPVRLLLGQRSLRVDKGHEYSARVKRPPPQAASRLGEWYPTSSILCLLFLPRSKILSASCVVRTHWSPRNGIRKRPLDFRNPTMQGALEVNSAQPQDSADNLRIRPLGRAINGAGDVRPKANGRHGYAWIWLINPARLPTTTAHRRQVALP